MSVTVRILKNDFVPTSDAMIAQAVIVVADIAQKIVAYADPLTPRDTGAESAGWYVVTQDASGYGQAAADAVSQRPNIELTDEVAPPDRPTQAIISNVAGYAIYQELGTARMPAQPALIPACDYHQSIFSEALSAALAEVTK